MQALVHIEPSADEPGSVVWWADVPEVPGFYAAAASLSELEARVGIALAEIASERGRIAAPEMSFHLAETVPGETAIVTGVSVNESLQAEERQDTGPGLSWAVTSVLRTA